MLNELIYTRCGANRNIFKNGALSTSAGLGFYSCSKSIFQDGFVTDFSFLDAISRIKHPCAEPNFMDDAYLYYTPEKGSPLYQNFYPIPNSKGRKGNFISQFFVGDLNAYPCEAFGSKDWDAKQKDEDHYMEIEPPFLPQRKTPLAPGYINFDKVKSFITQERIDAMKQAVAFVFAQFSLPPEERKFLIIKDTCENIELWIAAIEYAFPSVLACKISFATRMSYALATNGEDRNCYFIGSDGFRVDRNAKEKKTLLKAMLVGMDLRDPEVSDLKKLPICPYRILDGTQNKVLFDMGTIINNKYYSLITQFDDDHRQFLKLLSELKNNVISDLIYKICDAYIYLTKTPESSWDCGKIAEALECLSAVLKNDSSMKKELHDKLYYKLLSKSLNNSDEIMLDQVKSIFVVDNDKFAEILLDTAIKNKNYSDFIWKYLFNYYIDTLTDTNLKDFCDLAIKYHFAEEVEKILIRLMGNGVSPISLCRIFKEIYKAPKDTEGKLFFVAYIETAKDISQYPDIIDRINESALHVNVEIFLYREIDKKLPVIIKTRDEEKVERKLLSLKKPDNLKKDICPNSIKGLLLYDISNNACTKDAVCGLLLKNIKYGIQESTSFVESEYYSLFMDLVYSLPTASKQLMALLIFKIPEPAFTGMIKTYSEKIVSLVNKKPNLFLNVLGLPLKSFAKDDTELIASMEAAVGVDRFNETVSKIYNEIEAAYVNNYTQKIDHLLEKKVSKLHNDELKKTVAALNEKSKNSLEQRNPNSFFGRIKSLCSNSKAKSEK